MILLKIAKSGDRSLLEDRSCNSVLCLCSYGDNFILRMILVAITRKLPWSGLSLRATRTSVRVLSAACCAAKRKAYCC